MARLIPFYSNSEFVRVVGPLDEWLQPANAPLPNDARIDTRYLSKWFAHFASGYAWIGPYDTLEEARIAVEIEYEFEQAWPGLSTGR